MEDSIMENPVLLSILVGIIGVIVGIIVMVIAGRLGISRAKTIAKNAIEESNIKADGIIRQATLDGKQQVYELKLQAENQRS